MLLFVKKASILLGSVHPETRIFLLNRGVEKNLPQAYKGYSEDKFFSTTKSLEKVSVDSERPFLGGY